ncbi:MAG TPA: molybdenum cofactor biosynthesis protein MoaE [Flavobacterium alvei]|nr:molybdenum cofactor biosynthesis protein MoaE [Flavobacterium alvei]HQF48567.1 molybdenum cofactor biosynthesis protein MoaE [Flavobacterium alvei]HQK39462.1 molybdenum cofactor biosynthesis protein MoaE [Flavobacterium alvei]
MKEKKKHNVFVDGPISPEFIANSIAKHSTKTEIGAHDIFLGQVRKDEIEGKDVVAINYEAYQEMADELFHEIREAAFVKYNLVCMHIYHSLGVVKAGEICLFVFVSSKHRKVAFEACQDIVEQIKAMTPIWGKEIFEDDSYVWKENQI